jgi:structural maintenance of chromosome 1
LIQSACKLRLTGIKDELKHIEKELKKTAPDLKKVHISYPVVPSFLLSCVSQAQTTYTSLKEKIEELAYTVNSAEDQLFASFCQQINVPNIREYEERQLKAAQEESEARLRFDKQIARLTHVYASVCEYRSCLLQF